MGIVYRARHVRLNRVVALKTILAGQMAGEADVRRFRQEAEAAAALDHPGIVPVFEAGAVAGQHFFTMGFVEGQSLARALADGPLPPRSGADLIQKVAEAVDYAHRCGVIHRDLKPGNILLDAAGRPRVSDFGLAKRVAADTSLTATGAIVGTPSYMAPEQAAGANAEVGTAADIYALGAVLYCVLTGRPPFQAPTTVETIRQVVERDPVTPRALNPAVPRDLETICLCCLQKDPRNRYPSALDLAEDLGRWLRGEPITARPVSGIERAWRLCRRNPEVSALSAVLLLVLIGTAVGASLSAWSFREQADRYASLAKKEAAERQEAERQRGIAESNANLASEARKVAVEQGRVALAKSKESQGRLVAQLTAGGLALMEQGDTLGSLPWFVDALALDSEHASRGTLHRIRLGALLATAPRLVRGYFLPTAGPQLSFTADGKALVALADGIVRRLELESGQWTRSVIGAEPGARAVLLSDDARLVAAVDPQSRVRIWDVAAGRWLGQPILGETYAASSLRFSRDHRRLGIRDGNGVRVFDTETGREVGPGVVWPAPRVPMQYAFSKDGERLIRDGMRDVMTYIVQVFDVGTGQPISPPLEQPGFSQRMMLNDDGSRLITLVQSMPHAPGGARVWDVATGRLLFGPVLHDETADGIVLDVVLRGDGRCLVTAGMRDVRVWDLPSGKLLGRPLEHLGPVGQVALSADGMMLASYGGSPVGVRVWDLVRQQQLLPLLRGADVTNSLRFSEDGRVLWTLGRKEATGDVEARAWDVTQEHRGPPARKLPGDQVWLDEGGRLAASYHPSDPRLRMPRIPGLVAAPDAEPQPRGSRLEVSEIDTGTVLGPAIDLDTYDRVSHVALTANPGRLVAAIDRFDPRSRTVRSRLEVRDVRTAEAVGPPRELPQAASLVLIAPGGQRAAVLLRSLSAVAEYQRTQADRVLIVDFSGGGLRELRLERPGSILDASFSRDGRRLVLVQAGRAQVFDAEHGQALGDAIEEVIPEATAQAIRNRLAYTEQLGLNAVYPPDGRTARLALGGTRVHRVDLEEGRSLGASPPLVSRLYTILPGQDGRCYLAGDPPRVYDSGSDEPLGPPLTTSRLASVQVSGVRQGEIYGFALSGDASYAGVLRSDSVRLWSLESGLPITPDLKPVPASSRLWLRDETPSRLSFYSRSNRMIGDLDVAVDPREPDTLRALAELLSGQRLDEVAGPVRVESARLAAAWESLGARQPELPREPAIEAIAWHEQRATRAEQFEAWAGAGVHLDRLISERPFDGALRKRRGDILGRLGAWTRAADDLEVYRKSQPFDPWGKRAYGVLCVQLGRKEDYRMLVAASIGMYRRARELSRIGGANPIDPLTEWVLPLAVLEPEPVTDRVPLLAMAGESRAARPEDPRSWTAVGGALLRLGQPEAAATAVREAIALYGRQYARSVHRAPLEPTTGRAVTTDAASVTPETNEGTPRDWAYLLLAEQAMGKQEVALRWREKCRHWLDAAERDPPDPGVVGSFSDASMRAMVRTYGRVSASPSMMKVGTPVTLLAGFYLPTWVERLEIRILLAEAERHSAPELPENVFAEPANAR
jgi:WD40 repeat protein